jgi:hypothetical protein
MMSRLKPSLTPTQLLWLTNGVCWLLLVGFVVMRVEQVFFTEALPSLRLDAAATEAQITPPPSLSGLPGRNPFDPAGTPWQLAGSTAPAVSPGQVRGIVVLPGVGVALTDGGVIAPGAELDAGRLMSVKSSGAVVDTPVGPKALTLPGSNRPTLQDLNQASPTASPVQRPVAASKEGTS